MKRLSYGIKWTMAAVLLAGIMAVPAFAEKTTPATGKNSAVPAVPRAIPDLLPYHKFDPPKSKLFDISKLTISGDLRVRPEFRTNTSFAGNTGPKNNTFLVQQWARLGFNYSISPDVTFFFQPQYSKNWGANPGVDAVSSNATIFMRQSFMLVRNFMVPNLTIKAGRQLVVWGNHRMFGHFDWNNVGWAHDGLTANYKLNKSTTLQVGWLRTAERNCGGSSTGNCIGNVRQGGMGTTPFVDATDDGNIVYVRAPMKVAGMVLEPTYIWHDGGTGGMNAPRPANQSRHTLGGRGVKKFAAGGARVDMTIEGYYQFGEIGPGATAAGGAKNLDIEAYAFHIDGGLTLPVPMQPRLSAEFNMASGDKDPNDGKFQSFDQLYPTNHIHFGYMDRMSWKNMNHLAFGLQMRPNADSHFEVTGHIFSKQESTDRWYHAGQGAMPVQAAAGNTETDLGEEVDVVYTHFFTPGNHVAWQIGGGVFLPGAMVDDVRGNASEQTWGYTQLWVNF
ncbi:MAG: alginate export family protein [Nitrospira sp.]|nr:alginate export family protein [Nitrospira sp.]